MSATGRIGPNAVLQLAAALRQLKGEGVCRAVFTDAGLAGLLDTPPEGMVGEHEVVALHLALTVRLGTAPAEHVAAGAGRLTAAYLLANRIPALAQAILRRMPMWMALRLLCRAIQRHAWTFAGSGRFSFCVGQELVLTISGGPLSLGAGGRASLAAYYVQTFQGVIEGATSRSMPLVGATNDGASMSLRFARAKPEPASSRIAVRERAVL